MNLISEHIIEFAAAFLAGLVSVLFFLRQQFGWALISLVISGIILRVLMTYVDPFIWLWDEQFHALVAKNMTLHPLKPTLYDIPLLNYDYKRWDLNHVWLHKQPLFMWQMALSMKLFGYSEWAMRLPSAIMSVLLIPVVYRMGSLLVNKQVGFMAAFLTTYAYVFHELVTGSMAGDHNDMAFIFYVTLSVWSWLEYEYSSRKKWIILTGVFTGCAILVKWLPGLLVFSGWFMSQWFKKDQRLIKKFSPLLLSFGITLLVALPWQIFAYVNYPKELSWELSMYHMHFSIPVEGHGGGLFYQFQILPFLYGIAATFLLLPAFILLIRNISDKGIKYGVLSMVITTYVFYTLSATKMEFFCAIVSPLLIVSLACLIHLLFTYLSNRLVVVKGFILIISGVVFLQIPSLQKMHSNQTNDLRKMRMESTLRYKKMIASITDKKYCIVNCTPFDAPVLMFYTGMPVYGREVSASEIEQIQNAGYIVYKIKNGVMESNHE